MSRAGIMDTKQPFKGTLLQLQDKVKRDPAGYKDDVLLQLRHFESKIKLFELSPSTGNKDLCDLVGFLGHVAPLYKSESTGFPVALLDLLDKHRDVLDREVRRSMVQALCLLRSKNYVEPKDVLPLYFRLFKVQDRELRKILLAHIVGDVKRINSKIKNPATNKLLQNYMHQVVGEDDPIAGRHALWVIIDLYRRKIWTDDRIVNVISKACFSKHTKIMTTALRFLMGQYPKDMEDDAEDSEDELEAPSKNKRNYAKKTKGRETAKKKAKTQYERQQRKKDSQVNSVFLPIEVLNDPQGFAERLFSQLQRTKERFNVRMLHVAVLSAMIHAHKLMIFNFYPFLQRYMEPHQQNVTHIMAYASQAVHDLVPPENLHSLMMSIANHFVTDRASPDAITVGINTLREICRRQPLVMTEDLLRDIAQYKRFKRDKGVVMASRSMIQLFRELQPSLLARKDRGRDADLEKEVTGFGASLNKKSEFEGIELLEEYYEKKRLKDEARSSTGVGADDDEWSAEETDESSASGSWISVSQSDSEADQSDAEASDDDDEGGKRPKADKKQVKPAAKPAKPDGELSDDEEWEECSLDEEMEEDEDAEGGDDEEWEECSEGDSADFEEPTPKESKAEQFKVVADATGTGVAPTREELKAREEDAKVEVGGGKILETKFLTPRDFQILARLKEEQAAENDTSNKSKKKRKRAAMEDDGDSFRNPFTAVSTDDLEAYSMRKRRRDADEKRAHTEAVRESFSAKTKVAQKAGGTTNSVKSKRKLATMAMRSGTVHRRQTDVGKSRKLRKAIGAKRNLKHQYRKGGH